MCRVLCDVFLGGAISIKYYYSDVNAVLWTDLGDASLQVVLAHVRGMITDGLLCSLQDAAQVTAAALELLQKLQQLTALLLPARRKTK